jgi:hypothetical protein
MGEGFLETQREEKRKDGEEKEALRGGRNGQRLIL